MIISIFLVSLIGFALSYYAYNLEQKIEKNPFYKPVCDISDRFSCSKPILSQYGKLFGFSNALAGMVYYATTAILALMGQATILFYCALAALLASCVLAYILYARIKTVCLICTAIYMVNIILFLLTY
ncbi:MAG: vitamin K epoxide reductase family protein [Candidatus Babeliales bacterium]